VAGSAGAARRGGGGAVAVAVAGAGEVGVGGCLRSGDGCGDPDWWLPRPRLLCRWGGAPRLCFGGALDGAGRGAPRRPLPADGRVPDDEDGEGEGEATVVAVAWAAARLGVPPLRLPIDAPCAQCLRHGDPLNAQKYDSPPPLLPPRPGPLAWADGATPRLRPAAALAAAGVGGVGGVGGMKRASSSSSPSSSGGAPPHQN
jgi:hypothetical protein